jgi:cation:H+ antiporter
MDVSQVIFWIGSITFASVVIMHACESFEDASQFIGRNMPPGVRGATVNAIASSLPELLTASFFLILYHDQGGFSAGIATCAGSAVFNAVLIPAACMLAVSTLGTRTDGGDLEPVHSIEIGRETILRDGFFFVLGEAALIYFLDDNLMTWWMGAGLVGVYLLYFTYLMVQFRRGHLQGDDEDLGIEEDERKWWVESLYTFDFRQLFFQERAFTDGRAWIVLLASITVITAACYLLSESVMSLAEAANVPSYFAAVIFAAAATSVPDTFISVNDAMEGDYDDAISNAIGSNIFDITLALGLPLLIYSLFVMGGEPLPVVSKEFESATVADVQELRIALMVVTTFVLGIFLSNKTFGRAKASAFVGLYALWTVYVLGRALEWGWLEAMLG